MNRRWRSTAWAGLMAVLLAGCGGSPTASGGQGAQGSDAALNSVLDKVKGLHGDERADRLAKLARKDGGVVSFYTALTSGLSDSVSKAFHEEYGLKLKVYRASGEDLVKRMLEESAAGSPKADLVETGGSELVNLHDEGALAPYQPPGRSQLVDEALVAKAWTGSRIQVFTPGWNKKLAKQPPTSWEDLADDRFNGQLAMEIGNADWHMALTEYWTEEAGKSPQEVKRLWRDIGGGTRMIDGHSTLRELMISGEFSTAATLYSYMTEESIATGAPLAWRPAVSPQIIRIQGAGVAKGAPNPAGAVLLMDWLLEKDGGQAIFDDADIDPVHQDLYSLEGETYPVDVFRYAKHMERFQAAYEDVVRLGEEGEGP
ncbi:MAG: ABC transporter substrate-binding protein [Micromonosporaceae bacterium]